MNSSICCVNCKHCFQYKRRDKTWKYYSICDLFKEDWMLHIDDVMLDFCEMFTEEHRYNNVCAIVACDRNYGIGFNGDLLGSFKTDKSFFKTMTVGNVVVMGRKTYESLPNKRALPNRINVVLTRDRTWTTDDAIVIYSISELLIFIRKQNTKVFIIGGGEIYRQLLPICNTIYMTKIEHEYKDVDTYFPDISKDKAWACTDKISTYEINIALTFEKYIRQAK